MVNVSSIKTTVVKYRAKPQAAVQYEIVLSSGTLVYNQNKSDTIQGSLEWQVYRIEGDKRTRMSNNATGMECYCGYSDSPSTTANTNTTDNVTFKDGGAAEVKYESGVTNKFTIIYGEKKNGVFTQLARLDVPVNVVGENGKDSPSLQFACPSCIVRLSNDTYGTPVVARSNTANLYLGSTMLTDTYYYFGTMGESFKIGIGEEAKTINYNSWRFSVSNSGGTLTFSLIEVQEGAKEAINLPIFAISASTQTQYKEVSYAIARKGDPNVSIDFDNNNATLLYNSSTGKYVNAPVVTNVSVLVGSEDISKKAIVHITTVNLTGTVKRGLNSYPFDEEGIDDEIDGEGIIGIKVTGFLKEDSSVGSIIAHYEYENKMYTATFNVTRSVGRYVVDIIATPTQVSYNQTTGLASSSKVIATINAIDINGVRTENAIFANYGAMRYRYLGETTWRLPNQNTDKLEIEPDFTKRGIEFDFVDASRTQLDYETVPIAAVTNGGDAYLVNVASMNVAVMLSSISYGTSTGDVTNVVYMTKNNAVLSSGMEYNVPGEDGDEHSLTADGQVANDVSYNGWVFNYSYQNGRLTSSLVRVNEGSPTSVHIPIDVIYPTDNITRTVMISYSAIQKGPAGRSYKPNTPELYDPKKKYVWNDEQRDFIYYAFTVNDEGEPDDNGALSYFMYGVKEYNNNGSVTKPPSAKGGDTNWEYVSEYKSIIVNCLFGTNAIIGGFLMTNRTATASNGKCGLVLDGNEGSITSVGENSKTVLAGGLMTIFNNLNGTWRKNIEFGIKNGYAVMSYYDNNGNLLYDLGPSGLTGSSLEESKFEEIKIKKTGIIWESARLDKQGQWNTGTGTIYNKINNNYDSTIFGGGSGSIPYDRIGSTFTSVSIYRYTAARINGTAVAEPSLGLSTAAMAEKADGMYFTSKTKLGNSSGSLVNLASGIYGVTSDRQVKSSLVSLADEYVPEYQVLFNSFLNGKQGTVRVSGKTVIKVSTGANGMVPID